VNGRLESVKGEFVAVAASSKSGKAKIAIQELPWSAAKPAPVVLVSGTEGFLAARAIRAIREQLRAADPNLEVSDLDAAEYFPGQLLTLASPSLFGEPRLIRVSNVEKCNDAFLVEALEYIASSDADTTLVLRHGGGVRGKRLLDAIRHGTGDGVEIVCADFKNDGDKASFAAQEFRLAQRQISSSALKALVSAFSGSIAELASACQQLIADAVGEITDRTVDDFYGGRVEVNAFKSADAAIAGRPGDALLMLRHALGSGVDPALVVGAFASKLRLMAKLVGDDRRSHELARAVGAAPWQIDHAIRDLKSWREPGLARAIEVIASTDASVKGGSKDPIYALERMVMVVASYGRD
jgi:DNA polymerase-3 subunit delta